MVTMLNVRLTPRNLCKTYKPGFFQPGYRAEGLFYLVGSAKDTLGGALTIARSAVVYEKGSVPMVFDHNGKNMLNEKGELIKKRSWLRYLNKKAVRLKPSAWRLLFFLALLNKTLSC
jgi:hypothetical protein